MRSFWTASIGLLGLLVVFGCQVDSGEEVPTVGAGIGEAPAPVLPEGTTVADHVEVEPGVFLLRSAMESGDVGYVQLDEETLGALLDGSPPDGVPMNGQAVTCIEADGDGYVENTVNSTLCGGNPHWSGALGVASYYHQDLGVTYDLDVLWLNLNVTAPVLVGVTEVYGFVYVDGAYVGYVHDQRAPGDRAGAVGYWTTACAFGGVMDVRVESFHTMWDGHEALYVSEMMTASVACCF
jgi:hypothetical protein